MYYKYYKMDASDLPNVFTRDQILKRLSSYAAPLFFLLFYYSLANARKLNNSTSLSKVCKKNGSFRNRR